MPWLQACSWPAGSIMPRQFVFQRDYVLGTSFDLVVWAMHEGEAVQVESVVLAEIDRLGRILSSHDAQSEISQLNAGLSLSPASPDLIAVLRAYETWTARTGGALSGRLGGMISLWKNAEAAGIAPSATDLAACRDDLRLPGWRIDAPSGQVDRLGRQSLNVSCLGKGYILQKGVEAARAGFPGVWGLMLNLGGDISVWGNGAVQPGAPWRIFCADPLCPYDNAPPLTSIALSHGAVATSAAYERGFTVAGQRYSHILDPRTGWPAAGIASATAIARDSVTANALATTLCVLSPGEGLSLLRTIEGAEGLIIAADGTQYRSPGFSVMELPLAQVSPVSGPTPSVAPAAASPSFPSPASAPPLSPGQTVMIISSDQVSFAKGVSRLQRPVQPDEKFTVVSVNGDEITVADLMGYRATLHRSSLTTSDSASVPAVAATTTVKPATTSSSVTSASAWPATYQVTLGVELPAPVAGGRRMKRPFLALWVEDASGKPVRTLTVWGTERKYLSELSNWWKFAKSEQNVVSNTTRATRPPGKYQVVWDGLDDGGKPVSQGTYGFVLEVNAEHGSHEIQRGSVQCGTAAAQGTIPGATQFLDCPIAYGPPST